MGARWVIGGNDILATTNALVTFSGTVDDALANTHSLTVSSGSGGVIFGGAVGTTKLASLNAAGTSGSITLDGNVTTGGGQSYGGNTTIYGNLTTTAGGGVAISGTTILGAGITIDSSGGNGNILLAAEVVGNNWLLALKAGSGTIELNGETTSNGVGTVSNLTVDTSGMLTLNTGFYFFNQGRAFSQNAITLDGTIQIPQNISFVTTRLAGNVVLTDPANTLVLGTVTGGYALDLHVDNGGVTFSGIDKTSGLMLPTTGLVTLNSGTYDLDGGRDFAFPNPVVLNGSLTFGQNTSFGPVTLASATTFTASPSHALSLGNVTGSAVLTLSGNGAVTLNGVTLHGGNGTPNLVVGSGVALTLMTGTYYLVDPTTYIFQYPVTVNGQLIFSQPTKFANLVTLQADTVLDSSVGGWALTLGAVSGEGYKLSVQSGVGALSFGVGGTDTVVRDFIAAGGEVTLDGNIKAVAGGIDLRRTPEIQLVAPAITLDTSTGSGPIRLSMATGTSQALTLNARAGAITGGVNIEALTVIGLNGSAKLTGTVRGNAGNAAAAVGQLVRGDTGTNYTDNAYLINNCAIATINCIALPPLAPFRPTEIDKIVFTLGQSDEPLPPRQGVGNEEDLP